jgi:hypothetical protein
MRRWPKTRGKSVKWNSWWFLSLFLSSTQDAQVLKFYIHNFLSRLDWRFLDFKCITFSGSIHYVFVHTRGPTIVASKICLRPNFSPYRLGRHVYIYMLKNYFLSSTPSQHTWRFLSTQRCPTRVLKSPYIFLLTFLQEKICYFLITSALQFLLLYIFTTTWTWMCVRSWICHEASALLAWILLTTGDSTTCHK